MIKESIVLNEGFKNLLEGDNIHPTLNKESDMFVLEQALKKRKELADTYQAANINVNPLLCVQLPDRRAGQEDTVESIVQELRNHHNITIENGKLAVYLSENKWNLENIAKNDNETEVIIFKQAIALGWDCPRAQILALFRDWQSIIFSVQTLGRIMRMPEPKIGHYKNEKLNRAFVYTNLPKIIMNKDINTYLHMHSAKRIDDYKPLKLHSVHHLRQREKTRLSPRFTELFLRAADNYNLTKKIKKRNQQVQTSLIVDSDIEDLDSALGEEIGDYMDIEIKSEIDMQKYFDYFVRSSLSPYYPEARSIGRVKDALYTFFEKRLNMTPLQDFVKIINITLSEHNRPHFEQALTDTKKQYATETGAREEPLQHTDSWELPVSKNYGGNYSARNAAKSAVQPFYASDNESSIEKDFINFLEKSKSVEWWYKNGEGESINFAVPYTTEDGKKHPFYVDFIVYFTGGKIGLYDTKGGITLAIAGTKSDGLLNYIKSKKRTHPLDGGIVTPQSHSGRASLWQIYKGKGKNITSKDSSKWENLAL